MDKFNAAVSGNAEAEKAFHLQRAKFLEAEAEAEAKKQAKKQAEDFKSSPEFGMKILKKAEKKVPAPFLGQLIDGAELEGGGQLLRTSLALGYLLHKHIKIEKIRAGRGRGAGLKNQHLACVDGLYRLVNNYG